MKARRRVSTQQATFDFSEQRKQPHMPTRTPDQRSTDEWTRAAQVFARDNPEMVKMYHDGFTRLAERAVADGGNRITPRLAWERMREGRKAKIANGYQRAWSEAWRVDHPQWAHMIRGVRA